MADSRSTSSRPNILFLFTDDQRHDTIRALGNGHIETPSMDRLVEEGTAFRNAFIPGGTCPAVCMPSRAMVHTGRRLFSFEDHGETISNRHRLLGEHFAAAGYDTYGIGKWHNGPSAFQRSFAGGAEIFFGGMWDHWNVPAYSYQPTGSYEHRVPYVTDAFHSKEVTWQLSDHVTPGMHSTDLFADAAVSWLSGRRSDEPFFLYVSFMAPHDPRTMPEEYRRRYRDEALPLEPAFAEEYTAPFGVADIRDELLAAYPRTREEAREHLADYYAMVTHLDDGIGRILAQLEASGQLDNTVVVLAGDNGLALSNHGLYGKQSCFDHSVHVPLVASGPGIARGTLRDTPCYLLDTFPTLCDLAGIDIPATVEGRSLSPLLADGADHADGWEDNATRYLAYGDLVRGVRTARHKLIEYAGTGPRTTLLFDLESDPAETTNLATGGDKAALIASLRQEMIRLRDEWADARHPAGRAFWGSIERW